MSKLITTLLVLLNLATASHAGLLSRGISEVEHNATLICLDYDTFQTVELPVYQDGIKSINIYHPVNTQYLVARLVPTTNWLTGKPMWAGNNSTLIGDDLTIEGLIQSHCEIEYK